MKYSDFFTRREFHDTGLYNEFFRKRGIEFRIAKGLPGPPGLVTAVFLDRSGTRDFGARDRLLLNVLRPHLNQSYQNSVVVSAMRDQVAMVEQGLEPIDGGLVLLDTDGRPRLTTPLARRWLDEFFGAHATGGSLPDAIARWIARYDSACPDDLPPPMTPLFVEGEASCLVVRLLSHNSHRFLVLHKQARTVTAKSLECARPFRPRGGSDDMDRAGQDQRGDGYHPQAEPANRGQAPRAHLQQARRRDTDGGCGPRVGGRFRRWHDLCRIVLEIAPPLSGAG